jgi:hypothetical protein
VEEETNEEAKEKEAKDEVIFFTPLDKDSDRAIPLPPFLSSVFPVHYRIPPGS